MVQDSKQNLKLREEEDIFPPEIDNLRTLASHEELNLLFLREDDVGYISSATIRLSLKGYNASGYS